MRATYTSVFDGSVSCTSPCLFDEDARVVSDIEPAENNADAEFTHAITDEYVTLPDGTELREEDGVKFDY